MGMRRSRCPTAAGAEPRGARVQAPREKKPSRGGRSPRRGGPLRRGLQQFAGMVHQYRRRRAGRFSAWLASMAKWWRRCAAKNGKLPTRRRSGQEYFKCRASVRCVVGAAL